jgi:hypothetical protein
MNGMLVYDGISKQNLENLKKERFKKNMKGTMWSYHLETLVRIRESNELIQDYVEHNIMNIIESMELPLEINNFCLLNGINVVARYGDNNYGMDWHYDNRAVIKHKKGKKVKNLEKIGENNNSVYYLWDYKRRPKYTMIIYFTDYGLSHLGGELVFLDEEIKPMYGDVVFFNSNELHKVNPTYGTRNALVIKFYDLDKALNDS